MDQLVLKAVVEELAALLMRRPVADLVQLEAHRFLLRFEEPPFPRLHVAIHPRLSTLHLVRGVKAPSAPTELGASLTRELRGRRVEEIATPPGERLVRIRFEGGRSLVIELMGKSSNLLLLDEAGRILRFARSHHGEFRRPEEGATYQPPPVPPRRADLDPASLKEDQFRRIASGASPGQSLEGRLLEAMPGFSALVGREIARRAAEGEDSYAAYTDLMSRVATGRREPTLHAPGPAAGLPESLPLSSRNLFAFVFPLRHAAGLIASPAGTVNEAEAAASGLMARHLSYLALKQSLASLLKKESRKASDLADVLEAELAEAEEAEARDRRRAELILASLGTARKEGDRVRVTDHYDPEGRTVEIPIDPRLDMKENAVRYFRSARRRGRTRELVPKRLSELRRRLGALEAASARLERAGSGDALAALERELQDSGLVHAFRKAERPEVGRRTEYVKVREFRTRDGFAVLVGRTGAENDHLTFKVASPHDLWLHAAGFPGAHIIVRNPRRLATMPESTVREAAGIAAYFSKAKDETEVDVHVAWRRHVRKGRGMSPGAVMLKRHRTVRVAPALPAGAALRD